MGDDFGKLVLRLALGILVLLHGVAKLQGGTGFLHPMLGALGLPTWFAYGVYIGEIVAPIMVILGLFTRVGAFLPLTPLKIDAERSSGTEAVVDLGNGSRRSPLETFVRRASLEGCARGSEDAWPR